MYFFFLMKWHTAVQSQIHVFNLVVCEVDTAVIKVKVNSGPFGQERFMCLLAPMGRRTGIQQQQARGKATRSF